MFLYTYMLKPIVDSLFFLSGSALPVRVHPPTVRLLGPSPLAVLIHLIPRLGAQDVVDVLDLVVAPDGVVHALPAEGLEGVVGVRQGHPAAAVQVGEEGLVGKVHVHGAGLHVGEDLGVQDLRRVDDLEPAVHEAEGSHCGIGADGLGFLGCGVLGGEGAVLGDPVGRVVLLLEGVADAGVAGGEDAGARAGVGDVGTVEGQVHELVHVAEDEHVGIELDDAGVLGQGKRGELGPAVIEARVVGVVAGLGGEEVGDALGGDAAGGEGGAPLLGELVGHEGDEGVFGVDLAEGVVEGEEAWEVGQVGDEGCPDWRLRVSIKQAKLHGVTSMATYPCRNRRGAPRQTFRLVVGLGRAGWLVPMCLVSTMAAGKG